MKWKSTKASDFKLTLKLNFRLEYFRKLLINICLHENVQPKNKLNSISNAVDERAKLARRQKDTMSSISEQTNRN